MTSTKKEDIIGHLVDYYKTGKEKMARLKKQFSEDVCRKSSCGRSADGSLAEIDSICRNRPPETTNLMNACLSCRLYETCKILFVEGRQ